METKVIKKVSKSGSVKFEYYVDGKKVRTSIREYVASTVGGGFFWGRLDLVGKGEYNNALEYARHESVVSFEKVKEYRVALLRENLDFLASCKDENSKFFKDILNIHTTFNHDEKTPDELLEYTRSKMNEYYTRDAAKTERLRLEATDESVTKEMEERHADGLRRLKRLEIVYYTK